MAENTIVRWANRPLRISQNLQNLDNVGIIERDLEESLLGRLSTTSESNEPDTPRIVRRYDG
jgi:hypothetical protein